MLSLWERDSQEDMYLSKICASAPSAYIIHFIENNFEYFSLTYGIKFIGFVR